ncbi:Amino acid adenylation domain-containing protein OS=Streptomyces rimosus subsp. rimosus (strain ATCC / DSM 40260 / JCM 4667 / NRRL 2234) OX=1265868 GN=SRIM_001445 PE=4 SV=1 [Streptomyces rimosus subsp. rimosus]
MLLARSADLVTVLLGIAKAGAVAVPVDTAHPAERVRTCWRTPPPSWW